MTTMSGGDTRAALVVAVALITASCGDGTARCVAGSSQACACAAGVAGIQVCTSGGTYGACACGSDAGTDASAADAGTDAACGRSADADADGHLSMACGGDDCDDTDPNRYPGNPEVCDAAGHDEDCDPATLGPDRDGDGFVSNACCDRQSSGMLLCGTDCDDTSPDIRPTAPEVCDGVDDNCNGMIDEGVTLTFYRDVDGDGYGDATMTRTGCSAPSGYVLLSGDCDDSVASIHPAAMEICDGIDQNCDGMIDEGVSVACYPDADMDGLAPGGSLPTMRCACMSDETTVVPSSPSMTDCDDTRASVHPGAMELCDGRDTDCSSGTSMAVPAEDQDGDMHTDPAYTGCSGGYPQDDCLDTNPDVHPGQTAYFSTGYCTPLAPLCPTCPGGPRCVPFTALCDVTCPTTVPFSFDYDCSATTDPEPTGTNSCVNGGACAVAPGCDSPHFYYTGVPACGSDQTYWSCGCFRFSCSAGGPTTMPIGCH